MISRAAIDERVREWGLREDVVEKDYVIGWVLWGIGSDPGLADAWIFKGGTCLKKCYIETYRFSEDLDFTLGTGTLVEPGAILPAVQGMLARVEREPGINLSVRPPRLDERIPGISIEGRIYYTGPRRTPAPASIKLDLRADEKIVRPTVLKPISHSYPDELPPPATVRCYGFEEVFGEKLRALGERSRPRDLYDVINLYRRAEMTPHGPLIKEVLVEKCVGKGVPVTSVDLLTNSALVPELAAQWDNMLGHQLPALPPFAEFWDALPGLFAWLDGEVHEALTAMPAEADEELGWTPPTTIWTWGAGVPLEPIRFAGANRLCVELGYGGTTRLIEPYSLRRTRAGNIILHALKQETREPRAYRIDRIQSVKATSIPFAPVYSIEFSSAGPLSIPVVPSKPLLARSRRSRSARRKTYVIECGRCEKKFYRVSLGRTLRPHKDKNGWRCGGRQGWLVDTIYP